MFARNETSDAMFLRNTSCRYLVACTGTSLSSLWRIANYVTLECVWSMLKNNTCHRCPWDLNSLALCNRSSQLISASAFQRQSLDADTLALLTCTCVADTLIVTLNTWMLPEIRFRAKDRHMLVSPLHVVEGVGVALFKFEHVSRAPEWHDFFDNLWDLEHQIRHPASSTEF